MIEPTTFEKPRWLRDLGRFLPLKSQFVLSGNVRDLQIIETTPGAFAAVPLAQAGRQAMGRLGLGAGDTSTPAGPTVLLEVITRLSTLDGAPVALIVDFASRLVVRAEAMNDGEQRLFANALVQSHRARARPLGPNRTPAFNTIIWVVEREGSLPDWLIMDNPRLRHIPVAKPDNQ